MTFARTIRALCVGALLASWLLAGCSSAVSEQPPAEEQSAGPSVEAMSPERKRESMALAFPVEVPVPVGEVTRARTQGPDAWDYEIEVDATPEGVAKWYADAYTGRSWTIVGSGELTQGRGGYYLELRKNAAESRVDVLAGENARPTTVRAVVGIGAPVLETF
jgi:hypothetical protein